MNGSVRRFALLFVAIFAAASRSLFAQVHAGKNDFHSKGKEDGSDGNYKPISFTSIRGKVYTEVDRNRVGGATALVTFIWVLFGIAP
jgi:hypothetical protein